VLITAGVSPTRQYTSELYSLTKESPRRGSGPRDKARDPPSGWENPVACPPLLSDRADRQAVKKAPPQRAIGFPRIHTHLVPPFPNPLVFLGRANSVRLVRNLMGALPGRWVRGGDG